MKVGIIFSLVILSFSGFCQSNIGIGTASPDPSAMLDVTSYSQGILIPRVALSASNIAGRVVSPATGLLLFNTANAGVVPNQVFANSFYYNSGTPAAPNWVQVSSTQANGGGGDWHITGNAGTVDANNFLGTTDNVPLNFRVNNQAAGRIEINLANSFYGYQSGKSNVTGSNNTAIGTNALATNGYGNNNTAIGTKSLFKTLGGLNGGSSNAAIGSMSMFQNTSGSRNVAIGDSSLFNNQSGNSNVAIGHQALFTSNADKCIAIGDSALFKNTYTTANIGVGFMALFSNTSGFSNTAIGNNSLEFNSSGRYNIAIGESALDSNLGGDKNIALGNLALASNKAGSENISIGYQSLAFNYTGSGNVGLGSGALEFNKTGNNNVAIGKTALISNISGNENIAIGYLGLLSNTTGYSNISIGREALSQNTISSNLVAVGDSALLNNGTGAASTEAIHNTAIGSKSSYNNTTGYNNTSLGYKSLFFNNSGSYNTAIGHMSLNTNTTGSYLTAIGYGSDVSGINLSKATAIGYNAIVGSSNSLVLGGMGPDAVNVGIGVSSPIVTLHVKGSANIFSGANTHTGNFYNGNSNVDGIEMVSNGTDAYVGIQRALGYGLHITKPNVTSNNGLVGFIVNGIGVGSITTNGTTTSYNTTSDARLKENLTPTHYGLETLLKINVKDYNYKSDAKKVLQTGFIAQQLYELYPQAVQVGGEDVKSNPWMVDYSKLTPLLVRAVQEQQQQIEQLKSELSSVRSENIKLSEAVQKMNGLTDKVEKLLQVQNNSK